MTVAGVAVVMPDRPETVRPVKSRLVVAYPVAMRELLVSPAVIVTAPTVSVPP